LLLSVIQWGRLKGANSMQKRGGFGNLETMLIAGVGVVLVTILLAVVIVMVVLGPGQPPAATPTLAAVIPAPTYTSLFPPTATFIPVPVPATFTPVPATATLTPIPTETFTPIPPSPTPTGVKAAMCQNLAGQELNVRAGPGVEYSPPLGALSPGQMVDVIGKNAQDVTWWKIRAGTLEGWVSARYCLGDFDPNQVPIVYVPDPTPCYVQVPGLTQRKIHEAEQQARQFQLVPVLEPRCMPEGNTDLGNVVTDQSLPVGSTVVCGSRIVLTYFREGEICQPTPTPCWVQVPDLTQKKIEEAEELARQAQLAPVRDPRCMPEGDQDLGDVVTEQSLAAGSKVACQSRVVLTYIKEGDMCPLTPTPCSISSCTESGGELYTVRPGDWIAQLCRNRGYTEPRLDFCIDWTTLHSCISNPNNVQPGQEICLPVPAGAGTPSTP
jgi:hypothetical protein